MLRSALLLLFLSSAAAPVSAQTPPPPGGQAQAETPPEAAQSERLITITYDGGTRSSPDLRYGPYVYEHPGPDGVVAEVSNLLIYTQRGELSAPDGVLIADAEGEREASFSGGVRVERGRLTATGAALTYSEATGRGVMPQQTDIEVEPAEAEDDVVNITTDQVTFDVDTDTSVSEGNVRLTNGNQEAQAQELIYEEGLELAVLSSEGDQAVARRENDDGSFLTIAADEIRALTGSDALLAVGNVTIIDGDITSSGDTVYFDDEASTAEIIGNPATSVDSAQGVELSGARLEQRTDIDVVRVIDASLPSEFDPSAFNLTAEMQE